VFGFTLKVIISGILGNADFQVFTFSLKDCQ